MVCSSEPPGDNVSVARVLHSTAGAPIGEIFTFLSGLYFRGKLTYAEAFARPPRRLNSGVQLEAGRFYASLKIIGRLAEALAVEPAELLRLPSRRAGRGR